MSPSFQHGLAVAGLRLFRVRHAGRPETLEGRLKKRDAKDGNPEPSAAAVKGLRVEKSSARSWDAWTMSPTDDNASKHLVIAIPGGAYIQGIQESHFRAYADIARRTGATVVAQTYPLAPHMQAAMGVPTMADIIAEHIARSGAAFVSVIGDSAGAGLALAATQELVRRGSDVPGRLVLISPWLDVTLADPRSRQIDDPMLNVDGLIACGKLWAGDLDPTDWRVSPLYGNLKGIPHTSVYAGTLDCLVPDTWRLQERAINEASDIEFTIMPGLIHSWAGFTVLPEYQRTAPAIIESLLGSGQ